MSQVGIVTVTHGGAGRAMLATLTGLLGEVATDGMDALDVEVGEGKAQIMMRIAGAVAAADRGSGVVIACDLHGSTPTNCAVALRREGHVAVVCGVNLPMLLKLATAPQHHATPESVAQAAADTAVRSIRVERGKDS